MSGDRDGLDQLAGRESVEIQARGERVRFGLPLRGEGEGMIFSPRSIPHDDCAPDTRIIQFARKTKMTNPIDSASSFGYN
jgi:hypothetical protein